MFQNKIQPNVVFHKCDQEDVYIIHHILKNSASKILRYVLDSILDWNEVNLHLCISLDSYSFFHLCVFTMYYTERVDGNNTYVNSKLAEHPRAIECIKLLLECEEIIRVCDLNTIDRLGATSLHYIATIPNSSEMLHEFIINGGDLSILDKERNSVIHYAIKYKNDEIVQYLLRHHKEKVSDLTDHNGLNIISFCIQEYSWDCLTEIVLALGNHILDRVDESNMTTPFEFAKRIGFEKAYTEWIDSLVTGNSINWRREYDFEESKTMIMFHDLSFQHAGFNEEQRSRMQQKEIQVENPERAEIVINSPKGLIYRHSLRNIKLNKNISPAKLGDIVRVHDSNYIGEIKKFCELIDDGELCEYDGDTHISKMTWDASVYAAGACIEGVNQIMSKNVKNVFCCIRPPGHHAGVYGKVEIDKEEFQQIKHEHPTYSITNPTCTNGFCFLNNVCITAAYLKTFYREKIKKIVIIDFDVHHGNGTEQLIECLRSKTFTSEFTSPYFGKGVFKNNVYRPWCDEDDFKNILFVSSHCFNIKTNSHFYPGSGTKYKNTNEDDPAYPGGILNIPFSK